MRLLIASSLLVLSACASSVGRTGSDDGAVGRADARATRFSEESGPLRIALAGLVHQHAERLLWSASRRDDIEIVGVAEANVELFERLATKHDLDRSLRFDTLEGLLEVTKPEAVSAMTSIADHVKVVERCAPLGVHVLVEKPLAFSREHAERMAELARLHGTLVLTNYETSWYSSVREAERLVKSGELAPISKLIFRHGHKGPIGIGCYPEFTDWLATSEANGGGALVDFGCYGAVLSTWLMNGAAPTRVIAAAQTLKPSVYPNVDDDATIVLEYPGASSIIQASWNWTHDVKAMDLYTEKGSLHAGKGDALSARSPDALPRELDCPSPPAHLRDEWSYLREVIRGKCRVDDLSSLPTNVIVARILDDARRQVAQRSRKSRATKRSSLPPAPRTPRNINFRGRGVR
jgi:predicted dehydrogenase